MILQVSWYEEDDEDIQPEEQIIWDNFRKKLL